MTDQNYDELAGTGYAVKEEVAPEDEFFHSVYISGQNRKNHIGVVEQSGLLQIRGVEYNKKEVYGIILHTKQVMCNIEEKDIKCFSFQSGRPPYRGTSGIICGKNRAARQTNPNCVNCRAQMIVDFILTDANGQPLTNKDGKMILGFIRGKGMKYKNVSDYLAKMSQLDLDPVLPVNENNKLLEKSVVNNKRYVTVISKGTADSKHGIKDVFVLTKGAEIPKKVVLNVLGIAKQTLSNFADKFDWSKGKNITVQTAGDESNQFPEIPTSGTQTNVQQHNIPASNPAPATNQATTEATVSEELDFSGLSF